MAYKNLQQFIQTLEREGELVRIKQYVDPKLEMAEITDRVSKSGNGGKALLFENTGYPFPVLMNAYGSERRMCFALGVKHLDDVAKEIESLFKLLTKPKENILDKINLLPKLSQFIGPEIGQNLAIYFYDRRQALARKPDHLIKRSLVGHHVNGVILDPVLIEPVGCLVAPAAVGLDE
jgi:hypothetical protein